MRARLAGTRPAPERWASAPATGCDTTQTRFWMAMATAKTSRPQPKSADIGARNSPKLERMPKDSTASRQPAAITTSGVRQPGSAGRGEAVDGEAVDGDGRDIGRGREGRMEASWLWALK